MPNSHKINVFIRNLLHILNKMFYLFSLTLSTLGPSGVTYLTITGFSLPATNPNPFLAQRFKTTSRGSGGLLSYCEQIGTSYVVVLFK